MKPLRITVLSSLERCGIQTYSATLAEALREIGHEVEYVGVRWWKNRELLAAVGRIPRRSRVVIVEHEFGVFKSGALALAMAWLRLFGKTVILSMHELEPDKFHNYHKVIAALHYRMRGNAALELLRLLWSVFNAAQRLMRYRIALWLLGLVPSRIVFHSARAAEHSWLVTGEKGRTEVIPHFVEPLDGVPERLSDDLRAELRSRLSLPHDRFIFISPGFLFRRKRLIEVIRATPADALIVLSGLESRWDEGYLDEIREFVRKNDLDNVVINTDYATMPQHLAAADAVVLFYDKVFQSGIASHAVWAEKPLILSTDPSFEMYRGAALYAADEASLREAMRDVRRPDVAERLRRRARELKKELSPRAMAARYVEALERA